MRFYFHGLLFVEVRVSVEREPVKKVEKAGIEGKGAISVVVGDEILLAWGGLGGERGCYKGDCG